MECTVQCGSNLIGITFQKVVLLKQGLQAASEKLRTSFIKKYGKIKRYHAIQGKHTRSEKMVSLEGILVDVSVSDVTQSDVINEGISIKEIVTADNSYTLLSGFAGMGKTTLIKSLLYQWATKTLWNGEHGDLKFDFVFAIFCRNINKFKNDLVKATDLLKDQHPEVFDTLDMVNLRNPECQMLLIFEGFGELTCYEEFKNIGDELDKESHYCKAIYELLNPENSNFPFHRLITSRPMAHKEIQNKYNSVLIKNLVITGFSPDSLNMYIEKHFEDEPEKCTNVMNKLKETPVLQSMVLRPVFCWAVCCLLEDDDSNKILPQTFSSIYGSIFLIFLRNHGKGNRNIPFHELIQKPKVKELVLKLSEIAYLSLKRGDIVFSKTNLKDINIRDCGEFIETITQGDMRADCYQFTHSIFHEFLAALHIFCDRLYLPETFESHVGLFFSTSHVLLFLAGFVGGSLPHPQLDSVPQLYASLRVGEINPQDYKHLFENMNEYGLLRSELYYITFYEFQVTSVPVLPECVEFILPQLKQPLSSYDEICVSYLFDHLLNKKYFTPFKLMDIDFRFFSEKIAHKIQPFIKNLRKLIISGTMPGDIERISKDLPFVEELQLRSTRLSNEEFNIVADQIHTAHEEKALNVTFLIITDKYMEEAFDWKKMLPIIILNKLVHGATKPFGFNIPSPSIFKFRDHAVIPESVYKCLPYMNNAMIEVSIDKTQVLSEAIECNKRRSTLRLERICLIIKSTRDLNDIITYIGPFANLSLISIILIVRCVHVKDEQKRKKKNKYKDRLDFKALVERNNIPLKDEKKVITCWKCCKVAHNFSDKLLTKLNKITNFFLFLDSVCAVINDGLAEFRWCYNFIRY